MNRTDIKPCPFCPNLADVHTFLNGDNPQRVGYYVRCRNKKCTSQPAHYEFTEDDAVIAWNRRIQLESIPASYSAFEERQEIMQKWDAIRARIAGGDKSSEPRDWFKSLLDAMEERSPPTIIPEGYKLVPIDAPAEMLVAGRVMTRTDWANLLDAVPRVIMKSEPYTEVAQRDQRALFEKAFSATPHHPMYKEPCWDFWQAANSINIEPQERIPFAWYKHSITGNVVFWVGKEDPAPGTGKYKALYE